MKRPATSKVPVPKKAKQAEAMDLELEAAKRWKAGYSVMLRLLDPRELERCAGLVVTEATYYHLVNPLDGDHYPCTT
jgi:hypothetical protein